MEVTLNNRYRMANNFLWIKEISKDYLNIEIFKKEHSQKFARDFAISVVQVSSFTGIILKRSINPVYSTDFAS